MQRFLFLCLLWTGVVAALTPDETTLLQNTGGWEYQTITDANNGFQTQAVCFAEAFTGQCRGTLVFHRTAVSGKTSPRTGEACTAAGAMK